MNRGGRPARVVWVVHPMDSVLNWTEKVQLTDSGICLCLLTAGRETSFLKLLPLCPQTVTPNSLSCLTYFYISCLFLLLLFFVCLFFCFLFLFFFALGSKYLDLGFLWCSLVYVYLFLPFGWAFSSLVAITPIWQVVNHQNDTWFSFFESLRILIFGFQLVLDRTFWLQLCVQTISCPRSIQWVV